MTLRGIVIGFGSIGARHARVLESLGASVDVVSRRGESGGRRVYKTVAESFAAGSYDYAVVANETAGHVGIVTSLVERHFDGLVLIEKPLSVARAQMPGHRFRRCGVGYNLRFHPAVRALRSALAGRRIQMASLQVGQWLGDWRPDRDVALTYSASRAAGGGVLRDLSHELDLAIWLFGPWMRVAASGGRFGHVTVDSDDGWGVLLACERCPLVTLNMNYLDRAGRRTITVQSDGATLHADLIANTIEIDRQLTQFSVTPDTTHALMHKAMISGVDDVCTLKEGTRVVDLIVSIERAADSQSWISSVAK